MLVKLYGQEAFYNLDSAEDLVGHLFATLAPHTSGAILCRLIGFSDIKGLTPSLFRSSRRRT